VPNQNGSPKLADIPPLAAVCIVTVTMALLVALVVDAHILVTGSLAGLLTALGICIRRHLT
jgi:hypothetical protein